MQRARFYLDVGRYRDAALDYVIGISRCLEEENLFTAAYYLKEMTEEGTIERLFIGALEQFRQQGDLFWQCRALQELGWEEQLNDLLLSKADEIENSDDISLKEMLARARGDEKVALILAKEIAAKGL